MEIRQKLADDSPKVPMHRDSWPWPLHRTSADQLLKLGRLAEARDGYDRAIALENSWSKRIRAVAPDLVRSLVGARWARPRALGDPAGAASDVRRALGLYDGLSERSNDEWFHTACARATLAGLAGRDGAGVSAAEGKAEADQAMALLRKAVDMGYLDAVAVRTDSALDPLRQREDFKKLLTELEQKSAAKPEKKP